MAKRECRRDFLKKGIGMASASLIPFKFKSYPDHVASTDKKLKNILLQYGGEFGPAKPEPRRKNHGYI